MPRTKICGDVYRYKDIVTAIDRWRRYWGVQEQDLASAMKMSVTTWHRRKSKPEELTIEEIWKAFSAVRIPTEEAAALLAAGITGGKA